MALAPPRAGAGCAAGGSTLQQRLERAGARREPRPQPLLRPQGDGPARGGRLAEPDGADSPSRRAWSALREAACRPGRRAPVPTSLVSHGWSEVLFLKRLRGGLKQPPTSLPVRAVDCQPCSGQGTRAVHLAARTMGPPGWRRGAAGAPHPQARGRGRPSSRGLEAQGRKVGECCCPATGSPG